MAEDDIERLLREISATGGQDTPAASTTPARRDSSSPATRKEASGGRLAFAVIAAAGLGAATWFIGLVLPFTSAVSAGIGGAIAAFVTAVIAGPPRWFSS